MTAPYPGCTKLASLCSMRMARHGSRLCKRTFFCWLGLPSTGHPAQCLFPKKRFVLQLPGAVPSFLRDTGACGKRIHLFRQRQRNYPPLGTTKKPLRSLVRAFLQLDPSAPQGGKKGAWLERPDKREGEAGEDAPSRRLQSVTFFVREDQALRWRYAMRPSP